jgi:hypothetical protein
MLRLQLRETKLLPEDIKLHMFNLDGTTQFKDQPKVFSSHKLVMLSITLPTSPKSNQMNHSFNGITQSKDQLREFSSHKLVMPNITPPILLRSLQRKLLLTSPRTMVSQRRLKPLIQRLPELTQLSTISKMEFGDNNSQKLIQSDQLTMIHGFTRPQKRPWELKFNMPNKHHKIKLKQLSKHQLAKKVTMPRSSNSSMIMDITKLKMNMLPLSQSERREWTQKFSNY